MSTNHIRNAIFVSIGCAALSMGCSEKEGATDTTDSETTDTSHEIAKDLPPIPAGNYPECDGQSSESTGECCIDVYCAEPVNGDCLEGINQNADAITGAGLGSGSCLCDDVEGPYSNEGATAETAANGECCYLIGVQGCEGRPMLVEENLRKARLIRGKSWS